MKETVNTINNVLKQKCFGCGACAAICKEQAIIIEISREGFLFPEINLEKCSRCGLCFKVCPSSNPGLLFEIDKGAAFALWSKNSKLRLMASSGGAALQFSLNYFNKGYVPIGAVFKNNFRYVEHIVAKVPEDILAFAGSKYVQSNTIYAFKNIVSNPNVKYIAFGTPCQINALRNLLKLRQSDFSNYILVDFFCHGVPSYLLWWAFIKEVSTKIGKLQHIELRNKARGWHKYEVFCIGNKGIYSKNFSETTFGRFYLSNYFLNEPCYKCPYGQKSAADLRLGDFWGKEYASDLMGMSIAVALSQKGFGMIEDTEDVAFRSISVGLLFNSQPRVKRTNIHKPGNNERLMQDLIEGQPLQVVYRRYLAPKYWRKNIKYFLFRLAGTILPKWAKSALRFAIRSIKS